MHPTGCGMRSMRMAARFPFLCLALLVAAPLRAHDPGLSTTQVDLKADGMVATVGYAPNDIRGLLPASSTARPSSWSPSDFAAAKPSLELLGRSLFEVRDAAGVVPWVSDSISLAAGNSILFRLEAARRPAGHAVFRSMVMDRLPPGHRDYLSVTDEGGKLLVEKLEGIDDPPVALELAAAKGTAEAGLPESQPAPLPTFWGFLWLGITHIWTGYDHLLFLFGLLVVCRSFRSIVGIISCFTVAHSITLALATLNLVTIPSGVVEPAIAASIFYVGVENLLRKGAEPKGRWALTFAFGLIHGFGFASVLRELGIGSNGHSLAMPLFTFNLGVEIGQVSIALIVLPIVWQLRKNPRFVRRGVPILSALVAAAGLYWFLERTLF
jgi:hydrogenase/urease accessory protein HupE